MKKTFYEKIGRKYVPVKEYDSELMGSFPKGTHLVVCNPGSTSYKYNVDPDYASLIAASYAARDVLANGLVKASEMRTSLPKRTCFIFMPFSYLPEHTRIKAIRSRCFGSMLA